MNFYANELHWHCKSECMEYTSPGGIRYNEDNTVTIFQCGALSGSVDLATYSTSQLHISLIDSGLQLGINDDDKLRHDWIKFLGMTDNDQRRFEQLMNSARVCAMVQCPVQEANKTLLEQKVMVDFVIKIDNENIDVHRCFLAHNSPVFAAMLSNKSMAETQQGWMEIKDTSADTVHEMLNFIYTGKVDQSKLPDGAERLFILADKYAILPLKKIAEDFLIESIDLNNISSFVLLADSYKDSRIYMECVHFIKNHYRDVFASAGWREVLNNCAKLTNEILMDIVQVSLK